jgi:hypothetical protein
MAKGEGSLAQQWPLSRGASRWIWQNLYDRDLGTALGLCPYLENGYETLYVPGWT